MTYRELRDSFYVYEKETVKTAYEVLKQKGISHFIHGETNWNTGRLLQYLENNYIFDNGYGFYLLCIPTNNKREGDLERELMQILAKICDSIVMKLDWREKYDI